MPVNEKGQIAGTIRLDEGRNRRGCLEGNRLELRRNPKADG
jgi:hypothetical protein